MQTLMSYFPLFLLIFCRITAFFVVAPVFSMRGVPNVFKIGLSFFISVLIYMSLQDKVSVLTDYTYVMLIVREVLVGLTIGFTAYLFFTVVQTAGSFIDMQIGFGIANVIDPMTGAQSPLLGNFKFMIATLIFLTINGHHMLLNAIMHSYDWVPLSQSIFAQMYSGSISEFMLRTFSTTFMLAFQMAAPLVVSMFLTDIALGLLARTVPQMNIFVVGVPLKIFVGFIVMLLLVPGFLYLFTHLFSSMMESLEQLLQVLSGRGGTS